MQALEEALMLALEQLDPGTPLSNEKALKLLVALYQYLRTTKRADGSLDSAATRDFAHHLMGLCH